VETILSIFCPSFALGLFAMEKKAPATNLHKKAQHPMPSRCVGAIT